MEVKEISFAEFRTMPDVKNDGIVLLGAGGNPQEWIDGVTEMLNTEDIAMANVDELWQNAYLLRTTGGRTDLALTFNPLAFQQKLADIGKMAMWRIRFGDCSWISDYLVNYASHHGHSGAQRQDGVEMVDNDETEREAESLVAGALRRHGLNE